MSRRRFAAYFLTLSTCATLAFASYLMDHAASAQSLEFAAYLAAPIPRSSFLPHGPFLPKSSPQRNAPKVAEIAFAN